MSESTYEHRPGETITYDIDLSDVLAVSGDTISSVTHVQFDDMTGLTVSSIAHETDRVQFDLKCDDTVHPDHRMMDAKVATSRGNVLTNTGHLIIVNPLSELSSWAIGYTTVERLRDMLGLDDYVGRREKLLEDLLIGTTKAIDLALGRTFARQSYVERFRSRAAVTHLDPFDPGMGYQSGQRFLQLRNVPVAAITSVTDSGGNVIDPSYYTLQDTIGRLDFPNGIPFNFVDVSYDAGYIMPTATGRDLPEDIESSCAEIVVAQWYAKDRDPAMRSESAVDVGTVQYFKHGGTIASLIDMELGPGAALAPYREDRSMVGVA